MICVEALIPDIDRALVAGQPGDDFVYGKGHGTTPPARTFDSARYPITYRQFQALLDDPDGFRHPDWWEGVSANDEHERMPGQ